jgi:hypothetical protein
MQQSDSRSAADQLREAAQKIAADAMNEARQAVRGELDGARAERQSILEQMPGRSASAQNELNLRLREVDLKIEKLQDALERLGTKTAPATKKGPTYSGTTPPPNFPTRSLPFDPIEMVATAGGILFVAFPLTLAIVRFIWKRSSSAPAPAITAEQTRRFDRLEQSVDAIAIEVERISENQRYLTKLLGETKQKQGLGTGA